MSGEASAFDREGGMTNCRAEQGQSCGPARVTNIRKIVNPIRSIRSIRSTWPFEHTDPQQPVQKYERILYIGTARRSS